MSKRPNKRQRNNARRARLDAECVAFNVSHTDDAETGRLYDVTSDSRPSGGKRRGKRMRKTPRDTTRSYDYVVDDGERVTRARILAYKVGETVDVSVSGGVDHSPARVVNESRDLERVESLYTDRLFNPREVDTRAEDRFRSDVSEHPIADYSPPPANNPNHRAYHALNAAPVHFRGFVIE